MATVDWDEAYFWIAIIAMAILLIASFFKGAQ